MNSTGESASAREVRPRPAAPPPQAEHTHYSLGLICFYLSCAGVALGATVASAGPLLFDSGAALVIGCIVTVACSVTCFYSLRAARRQRGTP